MSGAVCIQCAEPLGSDRWEGEPDYNEEYCSKDCSESSYPYPTPPPTAEWVAWSKQHTAETESQVPHED